MSSAIPFHRALRRASWFAPAVSVVLCVILAHVYLWLPATQHPGSIRNTRASLSWPTASNDDSDTAWSAFRSPTDGGVGSGVGPLSKRFVLRGTFFYTRDGNSNEVRKAILDNIEAGNQYIVEEGGITGGVQVVSISLNRITLREAGNEEVLWLAFSGATNSAGGGASITGAQEQAGPALSEDETPIATNRFGVQVAKTRWIMAGEKVISYCNELQEHPARMEAVFDSMMPLYEENAEVGGARRITGYTLNIVGEADFFQDVGLLPGDVVRTVNTMPMTNVRRATYWIDKFLAGTENSFLIDIERNGEPLQLQYFVR